MNIVSGNRVWIEINKVPVKYPYLTNNIECDVAIIGGGIIGAICAYYMVQAGMNTVLLDKGIIGYSSTSASTSILQYEIDTDLSGLKKMIGKNNAFRSFKLNENAFKELEYIVTSNKLSCGFTRRECLYYTDKEDDVTKMLHEYELRKECGLKVEYIDSVDATKKFSFPISAGIYSLEGSGEIDPYLFTQELLSFCRNKVLQIYENTEVTSINPNTESVTLNTKWNKTVKAKKVIIATGYEALSIINKKIATLNRTFTIATKPVNSFDGWYNRCIIRDNKPNYSYLRTTVDNRILIGGEDIKIVRKVGRISNITNDDDMCKEKYSALLDKLKNLFPNISNPEIDYSFNGVFAVTKDGLPFIGKYNGMENCYFALCYGSNGILYGVLAGQYIRDIILGNPSNNLELFSFNRV